MTGYETYTKEERAEMVKQAEADLKHEKWVAEGNACLRSEIARSTVRTLEETIRKIKATK